MIVYTTMQTAAPVYSNWTFKARPTCSDQELVGWNLVVCTRYFCNCPGTAECPYQPTFLEYASKCGKCIDYPDVEIEAYSIPSAAKAVPTNVKKVVVKLSSHILYNCWYAMLDRCTRPNSPYYEKYQALGITVCERWLDPQAFFSDFPEYKKGDRFKRLDRTQGYTPENYILVSK